MADNSVNAIGLAAALLVGIALYLWTALALAAVFGKLGEAGWKAWVPVYNTVVFFRLGRVSPLWVIALFVPVLNIVGLVFAVIATHTIGTRFGKGAGYTVLGVLLQPVWASILGWGAAREVGGDIPALAFLHPGIMQPGAARAGEGPIPARMPVADDAPAPEPAPAPDPAGQAPPAPVPAAAHDTESLPATGAILAPGFSFTPLAIVPAPEPPAPIEMPVELSVRVPASAPRSAAPRIDAVPDFSAAAPAPAGGSEQARAASAVLADAPADAAPTGHDAPADEARAPIEDTIIVGRRNLAWLFETENGQRVPLTGSFVVLGRNPVAPAERPDAQILTVRDATRTISKTHACVELTEEGWLITDLGSTNGVYLIGADGNEVELEPGTAVPVSARFVLGEISARIFQEE